MHGRMEVCFCNYVSMCYVHISLLAAGRLYSVVLQIYASDHTSYGSSPSTPIMGSPPPLTGRNLNLNSWRFPFYWPTVWKTSMFKWKSENVVIFR